MDAAEEKGYLTGQNEVTTDVVWVQETTDSGKLEKVLQTVSDSSESEKNVKSEENPESETDTGSEADQKTGTSGKRHAVHVEEPESVQNAAVEHCHANAVMARV